MVRLSILLFLATTVLAVCALISCLSAEEDQVRRLPRVVWVPLILFVPLVGSIAWFLAGRPVAAGPGGRDRHPPLAPDDDAEFLRSIAERSRRDDAELFRRWEEDLRRREDDLRRREHDDDAPRREDGPPREGDRPEV
ncbi:MULTISPECIES: PLD nuclease N-terminal domain-containing protein [unclassified Micromonospora]|uniref:PLD nuclease N-terminal domain-containing protein n=1 Tax=unclassified Micromonospora TaxID=2617518 RepID=UPI0010433C25|nr:MULTISPECIES: PLD nuclease N-terminal domain-containing protein [unclassified Micromonospora]TDB69487.1 PLDc_N domain-containing protein [Micromonospora sp. KC721]TDC31670.1 PLDc_N domain-containing protein [Micromonospora sp. KC213]